MIASCNGNRYIVRALLENGANFEANIVSTLLIIVYMMMMIMIMMMVIVELMMMILIMLIVCDIEQHCIDDMMVWKLITVKEVIVIPV